MGCSKCGQKNSPRCNLCNQQSNKIYPWGDKRKICWRCYEKMLKAVEEHKMQIDRIETLLSGKPWSKQEYEKKVKKSK